MLFKSKMEKAFDTLRGYCDKHWYCEDGCKLYDKKHGCCVFRTDNPLCDIKLPRKDADHD